MSNRILSLDRRLADKPGGKWLFSRLVCLKAPYFASIRPRIETLHGVTSILWTGLASMRSAGGKHHVFEEGSKPDSAGLSVH